MSRLGFIILFITCACVNTRAQVNIIRTIAGTDSAGYNGDNIPDTTAELDQPSTLWLDKYQNIYISDGYNQRIRKIDNATGVITTIAGNGVAGYSGDSGLAIYAALYVPCAVSLDTAGNVYIADGLNYRIRKVTLSTGIITTVAGNGITGSSGDGGSAINAEIAGPAGVYVDVYGNIYITDISSNNIRKVAASTGIITTIAGTGVMGYSGDNGPATNAELNGPGIMYPDNEGNIIFSDVWNNVIRKINITTGIITTIAGNGTGGYMGDSGSATAAELYEPFGVYVDDENNVLISDFGNGAIRRVDGTTGIITTVAGAGIDGYSGDGGPATAAELYPDDVFLDNMGNILIADVGNNRIRKVYKWPLSVPNPNIQNGITVFPNPTTSVCNVHVPVITGAYDVAIYDLLGEKVLQYSTNFNQTEVDLSQQPRGTYFAYIYSGSQCAVRKIVKE